MTVLLPDLCPSSRQLTLGDFSVKRFRTQSGAVIVRLYGTRAYDYILDLAYGGEGGLPDSDTVKFYAAWKESLGHTTEVQLPDAVWGGADPSVQAAVPSYIRWFFSKTPPQIATTVPGYSKLRCTLRGRLIG